VPAVRRRNHCWKDALQQVADRNGAIEISLVRSPDEGPSASSASVGSGRSLQDAVVEPGPTATHLAWRVRVISVTDREILTEAPIAVGQVITLHPGVQLVGVMTIGQNRWMFSTRVISQIALNNEGRRENIALRLECPKEVERCHRREFSRVSTFQLNLPEVTVWPLYDAASAAVAERANQIQFQAAMQQPCEPTGGSGRKRRTGAMLSPAAADHPADSLAMPEVGPSFTALLVNIGGGGIGLLVEPGEADGMNRHRLFWLRIALPPELPAPLGVTGRVVHTHMDSAHRTYAGVAFEFAHHRIHQRFIVDQLRRYVELQQQTQLGDRYRRAAS